MNLNHYQGRSFLIAFGVIVTCVGVGLVAGLLVGVKPSLLFVGLVAGAILIWFLASFEQAVLGLLILRSSLDVLSEYQIPAAFAVGVDGLTLLYITLQLVSRRKIHLDWFCYFFAAWVALQGLWVILLPLGGLGLDGSFVSYGIREWVRLFSWLMVYLLVMQLKDRIEPRKILDILFLALVLPLTVALLQLVVPHSLPDLISPIGGHSLSLTEGTARVRGTLGHSNTFTTLLLLFMSLTCWKIEYVRRRLPWLLLLGITTFFFVSTKSLFGLMMFGVFIVVLIAPRLSPVNLIGALVLLGLVIGLFASSQFGQERLGSIAQTPLLNRDIDIWRAIVLSQGDGNSFNWRLGQWTDLLGQWQHYPWLGFGLGGSIHVSSNGLLPHNDYVRALIEGGIVGMITFLTFIGTQIIRLLQLWRSAPPNSQQRSLCWTLLAYLLAIPVGMITENVWSHTTLFFYWWTLLAIVGWDWHEPLIFSSPQPDQEQNLRAGFFH